MNEVYRYKKAELKNKIADLRQEVKANLNTMQRELERRKDAEFSLWFCRDLQRRCQQFESNLARLENAEQKLVTLMDIWDE